MPAPNNEIAFAAIWSSAVPLGSPRDRQVPSVNSSMRSRGFRIVFRWPNSNVPLSLTVTPLGVANQMVRVGISVSLSWVPDRACDRTCDRACDRTPTIGGDTPPHFGGFWLLGLEIGEGGRCARKERPETTARVVCDHCPAPHAVEGDQKCGSDPCGSRTCDTYFIWDVDNARQRDPWGESGAIN